MVSCLRFKLRFLRARIEFLFAGFYNRIKIHCAKFSIGESIANLLVRRKTT